MDDGVVPRLLLVSHCLLNPFSAVKGRRSPRDAARFVISAAVRAGIGILQLPCPEFLREGPTRWGKVHEQLDTVVYRRHCQALVEGVMEEVREYLVDGARVVGVIGVEGSPSCGAYRIPSGPDWGGDFLDVVDGQPWRLPSCTRVTGRGVFLEILAEALEQEGLEVPVIGLPDDEAEAPAREFFLGVVERMLSPEGLLLGEPEPSPDSDGPPETSLEAGGSSDTWRDDFEDGEAEDWEPLP